MNLTAGWWCLMSDPVKLRVLIPETAIRDGKVYSGTREPTVAEVIEAVGAKALIHGLIALGEIGVEFSDPRLRYFTAQIDADYLPEVEL